MDIRPQDLPELRAELVMFLRALDPQAIKATARALGGDVPDDWLHFHYRKMQLQERSLSTAELFYVSPEMSQLAVASGISLPEFVLEPEDVPTTTGLMFFGSPLLLDDGPDDEPTWAASWRPSGSDGLHIDWYNSSSVLSDHLPASEWPLAAAFRTGPRLQSMTNTQIPFGRPGEYGEAYRGEPYGPARRSWLNSVKAAWLLMQQPLANVSEIQTDRAARKRLRRVGHEPAPVRVIELRRPKHTGGEPGESGRNYTHRWITRGHWRQQWYPARQVHRPVWIAPHVKGPEGAPMIGGEKVYAWKR